MDDINTHSLNDTYMYMYIYICMFLRGFGFVKHISKHVFYRCLFAIHPSQYRTRPSPSNCTFARLVYDLVTFAERIVNRVQSSQTMKAIIISCGSSKPPCNVQKRSKKHMPPLPCQQLQD